MIGGVTRQMLPHLPVVPHLHVNRPLNSTPGPSRSHTMHISRYNMGIPRMLKECCWPRKGGGLLLSPATSVFIFLYVYSKAKYFLLIVFWSTIHLSGQLSVLLFPRSSVIYKDTIDKVAVTLWKTWFYQCLGLFQELISSNWTLIRALLVLGTLEDWDAAFSKCRVQLLRVNERRQKVRKAT